MNALGKFLTIFILSASGVAGTPAFISLKGGSVGKYSVVHSSSSNSASDSAEGDREKNWEQGRSFKTYQSGLKTLDLAVGEGDSPCDGDLISVHYAGWHDSFEEAASETTGVIFDNSRNRGSDPLKILFGKAQIIEGWNEGLKTMKVGGKREFIIPPELGYGDKEVKAPGQPGIPANAYLRFVIELVEVDNSLLTKFRLALPKPSGIFENSWF